jgi:hypothetical protein
MKTTSPMTHLKQNKQSSAFTKGAAAVAFATCTWAISANAADDAMHDLLTVLRQRGSITEAEYQRMLPKADQQASVASNSLTKDALKKDWFGKLSIRGYVQTRYTHVIGTGVDVDNTNKALHSPTEPNISERDSLFMRRARMIFSGDVHDHLFLYAQVDWQAGVNSGYNETNASGLQTRDMYGDVSLDHDKEHRIRIGISKVPYGFVNLQSSQNRLSIERPEALNSAVEGERDLGVYYMWADKTARERFRELVKLGLKGSGDYGVFTAGVYNGQGLNKYDGNRAPHVAVRLAYPFQLDNGQFFEVGLSGYDGKFVLNTGTSSTVTDAGVGAASSASKSVTEYVDRRVAANFVWYPQPFGIEAEWTFGEGPERPVRYNKDGINTLTSVGRPTIENLHGGYVLFNYKADTDVGTVIPFTRWSYFDGARKFANARTQNVNELDFGVEYQPWPSFEVALLYTHAFYRTNTSADAANLVKGSDRVTCQLQFNF